MTKRAMSLWRSGGALLPVCLMVGMLVFLPSNQAQGATTLVIDHFTTNQTGAVDSGTPDFSNHVTGSMLGGHRWFVLHYISGTGAATAVSNITTPHHLDYSLDTGTPATSAELWVVWNGSSSSVLDYNLGNIDFTDYGKYLQFILSTLNLPLTGTQTLVFRVYTDATHWSEASRTITTQVAVPTPFSLNFAVDFSAGLGAAGPADFQHVNRMELYVNGGPALDMTLDEIGIDCVAPKPTFSQHYVNPSNFTPCPPPDKAISICYQVPDDNATVRLYDVTGGYPGTLLSTWVKSTGLLTCYNTSISSAPRYYFFSSNDTCESANATAEVTCQAAPTNVPSLNVWGMLILMLFLGASALWQLRKKRSAGRD